MWWSDRIRECNAAALWSGLTAFVWYAFGAVPLQVAVAEQLHLSTAQTSSWIFIVWFGGAVVTVPLVLMTRQPISITWTIPGLIYLGTLAERFAFPELLGANLVAGIIVLVLSLLGFGRRILRWLPLPIVMGMFAGSILGYATRAVDATIGDAAVAGVTVLGYVLGRAIRNQRIPPVAVAVIMGAAATLIAGRYEAAEVLWTFPVVSVASLRFSLSAVFAVSIPLAVLVMGLGNVQGMGFLLSQGYAVPVNRVSGLVGVNSVINAVFGGHPATVARISTAMLASPEAGPLAGRYWASLLAAVLTIGLAFAAVPVASLIHVLPSAYVVSLAGVAILSSLQDAMERSFVGPLRFGPLVAFVVAATPFILLGITSALWSLIAGMIASLVAERRELLDAWRR
jgi:benzoate membrane transport protein